MLCRCAWCDGVWGAEGGLGKEPRRQGAAAVEEVEEVHGVVAAAAVAAAPAVQ